MDDNQRHNVFKRSKRNSRLFSYFSSHELLSLFSILLLTLSFSIADSQPFSSLATTTTATNSTTAKDAKTAEDLVRQFCGATINKNEPDAARKFFNTFIFRGDSFTNGILNFLTSAVGGGVASIYLKAKGPNGDTDYSVGAYLRTGFFFAFVIGITILLSCIVYSTTALSEKLWKKKAMKNKWTRLASAEEQDEENPTSVNNLLLAGFVLGLLFLISVLVFLVFVVKLPFTIGGFLCQLARLIIEIQRGVMYDQNSAAPAWLPPKKENATQSGLDSSKAYLSSVQETFVESPTNKTVFKIMDDALDRVVSNVTTLLEDTGDAIKTIMTPFRRLQEDPVRFQCVFQPSVARLADISEGSCKDIGTALHETKVKVDANAEAGIDTIEETAKTFHESLANATDQFKSFQQEMHKFRHEMIELVPNATQVAQAKTVATLSISTVIIIIVFSLVGIALLFGILLKLASRYGGVRCCGKVFFKNPCAEGCTKAKTTCAGICAKAKTSCAAAKYSCVTACSGCVAAYCGCCSRSDDDGQLAREAGHHKDRFKCFSKWFTFSGAALFSFGGASSLGLIFTNSCCNIIKSTIENTALLQNYKYLEKYYPKDGSPELKQILDHCFLDDDKNDFVDVFMGDARKSYMSASIIVSRSGRGIALPDKMEKIVPVLDSVKTLGSTVMPDPKILDTMFFNIMFAKPEILLCGSQPHKIDIKDELSVNFWKSYIENANENRKKHFPNWPTEYDLQQTKVLYGWVDQLDAIQSISNSPPLGCNNLKFCVQSDQKELCSQEGLNKINITDASFSKPPEWKLLTGFATNLTPEFQKQLEAMKCKFVQPGDPSKENKRSYDYNSFLVGLFLSAQKVEFFKKTEKQDTAQQLKNVAGVVDKYVKLTSNLTEVLEKELLRGLKSLSTDKGFDCGAFLHSIGVVVDGFCGGIQGDVFWIGTCWSVMALLTGSIWFICYKFYALFKKKFEREAEILDFMNHSGWGGFIINGDYDEVSTRLLSVGTTKDKNDVTSLHVAAYIGDNDLVTSLVEGGAVVDAINRWGFTALSIAACRGHDSTVSLLLELGADPTIQDEFGDTALHAAVRSGNLEVVKALCNSTAVDPVYLDNEGDSPVDVAHICRQNSDGNTTSDLTHAYNRVKVEYFMCNQMLRLPEASLKGTPRCSTVSTTSDESTVEAPNVQEEEPLT